MRGIIIYNLIVVIKYLDTKLNINYMIDITTILASSFVSTLIASVVSLIVVNKKYDQEYKKILTQRKLDVYEKIELILESITFDHKNEIILLSTDIDSYNQTKTYIKTIITKSYLMSKEAMVVLMELSLKLNEYDKYFKTDFENLKLNIQLKQDLSKIRQRMTSILKNDYKRLHKI